jgi:hypothetical protein
VILAELLPKQNSMAKPLHIQILEYLQLNNAAGVMFDIKPAFENELDTLPKRKEFKAELEYLLKEKLIEGIGRYEFLGWELITGLYPLDNKKIEAKLSGQWETYLASKRPHAKRDLLAEPTVHVIPHKVKTVSYADSDAAANALPHPATAPQPVTSLPVVPVEPVPQAIPTITPAVQAEPAPNPAIAAVAADKVEAEPQPAPVYHTRIIPTRVAAAAQRQELDAPIITARTAHVLPKPEPAAEALPAQQQPPATARIVKLQSVADMPPGPVSLRQAQPAAPQRAATHSTHFATDNNPFAGLEIIDLHPESRTKKLSATTILKWSVTVVALVLLVLVYLIYKRHTAY